MRLKVASYNIRKAIGTDRRRNPERILQVLREIDADVVALQEADRRFGQRAAVLTPHLLEEHSDWRSVGLGMRATSMGWHGNALLVRKSATILDCQQLHLPALEPRGAVCVDVAVGDGGGDGGGDGDGGGAVRVIGMHLDLSGLWRRRQAAAILQHAAHRAPGPATVMMGDLNEWTRASGCLSDFARDFHFAETGPSFHARRPIARLDRIMVSRALRVAACGVHQTPAARVASDHLPIWAEIVAA